MNNTKYTKIKDPHSFLNLSGWWHAINPSALKRQTITAGCHCDSGDQLWGDARADWAQVTENVPEPGPEWRDGGQWLTPHTGACHYISIAFRHSPSYVPCIRNRLKWSNLIAEQDDKKSLGLGKCKVKRLELLHEYKIQVTIHIADVRWHLLTHFTVTPGPQDLRFVITVHSVLLGFTENLD